MTAFAEPGAVLKEGATEMGSVPTGVTVVGDAE